MDLLCGIDEAGRGPLSGPVTAAAVILPRDFPVEILADSKALSPARREEAAMAIRTGARWYGIGWVWHYEIDLLNIHHASMLAMVRAFNSLGAIPARVVVDGLYAPPLPCPGEAVVKADATIPEVMAASIIAKTARDRWMTRQSWIEPGYLFEKHKGYPTLEHRRLCLERGASSIQRKSFRICL